MSFKGFVKVNYFRFAIITVLSISCGLSVIGAGYIQMYWLTSKMANGGMQFYIFCS